MLNKIIIVCIQCFFSSFWFLSFFSSLFWFFFSSSALFVVFYDGIQTNWGQIEQSIEADAKSYAIHLNYTWIIHRHICCTDQITLFLIVSTDFLYRWCKLFHVFDWQSIFSYLIWSPYCEQTPAEDLFFFNIFSSFLNLSVNKKEHIYPNQLITNELFYDTKIINTFHDFCVRW